MPEPVTETANPWRDLRLGFFGSRSAYIDEQGTVWTDAGLSRPLLLWAERCQRLTVALSVSPVRQPLQDQVLPAEAIDFLPLPWMPSMPKGIHRVFSCRRVMREVERRSDAVVVQLSFESPLALIGPRKPRVYHVVGDVWAVACQSTQWAGWKRPPALLVAGATDRLYRRLLHRQDARAVVNGTAFFNRHGLTRGRPIVSSTMYDSEVMSVSRTRPPDAPFRVLFVGNFRQEKGLDTLLEAFETMLTDVPDAELEIVGTSGPSRSVDGKIRAAVERLSAQGKLRFLGVRAFGQPLFECYANADVLAVPSRSEGTPRAVIEARAFGCPVVAARVGGVPTSVSHEQDGLLIPHDDPRALRDGLLRIKQDHALRSKLIENGITRARSTSVNRMAEAVLEETASLVGLKS
jgi:glycosyltransferase involved in cell wall biosynthesis